MPAAILPCRSVWRCTTPRRATVVAVGCQRRTRTCSSGMLIVPAQGSCLTPPRLLVVVTLMPTQHIVLSYTCCNTLVLELSLLANICLLKARAPSTGASPDTNIRRSKATCLPHLGDIVLAKLAGQSAGKGLVSSVGRVDIRFHFQPSCVPHVYLFCRETTAASLRIELFLTLLLSAHTNRKALKIRDVLHFESGVHNFSHRPCAEIAFIVYAPFLILCISHITVANEFYFQK